MSTARIQPGSETAFWMKPPARRAQPTRGPETLDRQLAVLLAGAVAVATFIDDVAPFDCARPVAAALVDQAIPRTAVPETGNL